MQDFRLPKKTIFALHIAQNGPKTNRMPQRPRLFVVYFRSQKNNIFMQDVRFGRWLVLGRWLLVACDYW
jgi:hypothetical protein